MDRDLLIKKLIYQSNHRGCKETDFMLGDFAKNNCPKMTDKELQIYTKFIQEDDWDIYNWVNFNGNIPLEYINILQNLRNFQ